MVYISDNDSKIISSTENKFKKITTLRLQEMKDANIKISCLTGYDALIGKILDESGIDLILIGDSVANVVQGRETTIPVTIEEIIYHTKAVLRGTKRPLIVSDMPFMSYQVSADSAFENAGRIMKESGCEALKLEGASLSVLNAVERLNEAGIPCMGHLGLTPQSINKFGSYRARGKDSDEAKKILEDAKNLENAGAFAVVLEKIPYKLAEEVTNSLKIPTIGIGAGPHCDGQILVYSDMLGLTIDFRPRFVRQYANLNEIIKNAFSQYCDDVKNGKFPSVEESY